MRAPRLLLGITLVGVAACGLSLRGSDETGENDDGGSAIDGAPSSNDGETVLNPSSPDASTLDATASDATTLDATAPKDGGSDAGLATVLSMISPYDPSGSLTYAFAIDWTIASDPPVDIYATFDNSTPTTASQHGLSPIVVSKPGNNTVIKWIAGTDPTVHTFTVKIDSGLQTANQGMIAGFTFKTVNSPIVHAAAGSSVTMIAGTEWEWAQNNETGDQDQLTIGMDAGVGCMLDTEPGGYSGVQVQNVSLALTVPSAPGSYPVRIGFMQQFGCFDNLSALAGSLGATQVGLVIVP